MRKVGTEHTPRKKSRHPALSEQLSKQPNITDLRRRLTQRNGNTLCNKLVVMEAGDHRTSAKAVEEAGYQREACGHGALKSFASYPEIVKIE